MTNYKKLIIPIIVVLAITGLGLLNKLLPKKINYQYYYCDAESLNTKGNGNLFKGTHPFRNGQTQNNEYSFSGSYASKLSKDNLYGMSITIPGVCFGDSIIVTAWRYGTNKPGSIVIQGDWGANVFQKTPSGKSKGWEKLVLKHLVAGEEVNLKIYTMLTDIKDTVYFDDFSIKHISASYVHAPPLPDSANPLIIKIDSISFATIQAKRKKALENKILQTLDEDYLAATLYQKDKVIPITLRLKGDWTDHLTGKKWSYRIKVKNDKVWKGMENFSIQNPKTRYYLHEWVLHQLFNQEDVLSPRYGFTHVVLNDDTLGLYAWEEHFKKQLVENKQRRQGPIVKFNEDELWANRLRNNLNDKYSKIIINASDIEVFSKGATYKDSTLFKQYLNASKLMFQYKYGLAPASQIFDIDKLAKYFAIIDITKAQHGLIWHNQRFYFNPISCKLEPIGYDGYSNTGPFIINKHPFIGYQIDKPKELIYSIFSDSTFYHTYLGYLKKYSDSTFIDSFITSISSDIKKYEQYIGLEFPQYQFSTTYLHDNARNIRHALLVFSSQNLYSKNLAVFNKVETGKGNIKIEQYLPIPNVSLIAYCHKKKKDLNTIAIENFHPTPLIVTGYIDTLQSCQIREIKLKPYLSTDRPPIPAYIELPSSSEKLIYKVEGIDSIFVAKIKDKPYPSGKTPLQEIFDDKKIQDYQPYSIKGNTLVFNKDQKINTPIVIKEGYVVIFEKGIKLDFINKAFFLSYSPVIMKGTSNSPINIVSSDHTALGFTVLEPKNKSDLSYVTFDGFNTLAYKGWQLTGAVTFYESAVEMEHVTFSNNVCEDALNTIRSSFKLTNCTILNAAGDGFDGDFCKGSINACHFEHIFNDAIDFSGSSISIYKSSINYAGDKGISIGEASQAEIDLCSIQNATTAVCAKDKSEIYIQTLKVINCEYDFAAYQKKAEYGAAKLIYANPEREYNIVIDSASVIKIGDKEVIGTIKINPWDYTL